MPRKATLSEAAIEQTATKRKRAKGAPSAAVAVEPSEASVAAEAIEQAAPSSALAAPVKQAFSRDDLHRLELGQLRVTNAEQAALLQRHALEAFVRDAQEKVKGEKEKVEAKIREYESQKSALASIYADLEARYSVDMKHIAYDPKSGIITRLPPKLAQAAAASEHADDAIVAV